VLGGSRAWGQSAGSVGEFEWHGFLLGNGSGRTTGRRPGGPEGGDFLLGEERLRLDLTAWADFIEASARVKADLVHDAVAGAFDVDLREAYVAYTVGAFDVRLGRQIVTWGVGDLLFINDVFPKDFVSFFAGRPLEHLKVGVDALRTRYSSSLLNAELVVIPLFEPGNLPTAERFVLFDPFAAVPARQEERPPATFGNTELALRLYRQLGGFDVSVYAYRGFWRTPGLRPDTPAAPTRVTVFFPAPVGLWPECARARSGRRGEPRGRVLPVAGRRGGRRSGHPQLPGPLPGRLPEATVARLHPRHAVLWRGHGGPRHLPPHPAAWLSRAAGVP
jgi:hypothetical protein